MKKIIAICFAGTVIVIVIASIFSLNVTETIIGNLIAQGQLDIKYFSDGWEYNYAPVYLFIVASTLFTLLYYIPIIVFAHKGKKANIGFFKVYPLLVICMYAIAVIIIAFSFLQIALVTAVPSVVIILITGTSYFMLRKDFRVTFC